MTPDQMIEFQRHAVEAFPNEAVGMLTVAGYVRLDNVAESPTTHARPDDRFFAAYEAGEVLAFCHSHPGGPNCPSAADMRAQMQWDIPFWIVATNGEGCLEPFCWGTDERPALKKRPFRHGVTDCYSLIRDFYFLNGIDIPEFPRNWDWWAAGENLYEENFRRAGFVEVPASQARDGDVLLFSVRWSRATSVDVINHGGVFIQNGLLLHHVASREPWDPFALSGTQPLGRWASRLTKVVRYSQDAPALWKTSP